MAIGKRKPITRDTKGARTMRAYTILTALLYGRFEWLERLADGSIIIPTNRIRMQLKMAETTYKNNMSWLTTIGLFTEMHWHGHYCRVKLAVPIGMCRHMPSITDVETYIVPGHIVDNKGLIRNCSEKEEEAVNG